MQSWLTIGSFIASTASGRRLSSSDSGTKMRSWTVPNSRATMSAYSNSLPFSPPTSAKPTL